MVMYLHRRITIFPNNKEILLFPWHEHIAHYDKRNNLDLKSNKSHNYYLFIYFSFYILTAVLPSSPFPIHHFPPSVEKS